MNGSDGSVFPVLPSWVNLPSTIPFNNSFNAWLNKSAPTGSGEEQSTQSELGLMGDTNERMLGHYYDYYHMLRMQYQQQMSQHPATGKKVCCFLKSFQKF